MTHSPGTDHMEQKTPVFSFTLPTSDPVDFLRGIHDPKDKQALEKLVSISKTRGKFLSALRGTDWKSVVDVVLLWLIF